MQFLLFTAVIFMTFLNCLGQEKLSGILPLEDSKVTYTEVIHLEGIDSDELFHRANIWFVHTYNSANNVIQMNDKEHGEIIGKGNFNISYYLRDPNIKHTISISVKEGRYKYKIYSLSYTDNQGSSFDIENFPSGWAGKKKLYNTIDQEIQLIIVSLKEAMSTSKDEDW